MKNKAEASVDQDGILDIKTNSMIDLSMNLDLMLSRTKSFIEFNKNKQHLVAVGYDEDVINSELIELYDSILENNKTVTDSLNNLKQFYGN